MPHLGFKSESGLSKFLRRDLSRPFSRPANDGGDAAAIFEQTALVLRLEAHVSEACEMQHRPEAIGSIREIVARDGGARSRIETAENHVQTPSEDIRFISDQTNLLVDFHVVRIFQRIVIGLQFDHADRDQSNSRTMTTSIAKTLLKNRNEILQEWLRQQLSAQNLRADLISETELRSDSERFLNVLTEAVQFGNISDILAPEYKSVLEMLESFSRSRGLQGFTPSETATFVFSLKEPLFSALRKSDDSDPVELVENMLAADFLLDKLGLYTTEVYQQSREQVIRRQQDEMLELSTPVVQLWEGIVALPLIGTLDSARTSVVMETLLQTIVETRSELAIIDITGVPTVDTLVAQHLLKTVAAARLMGADCIISGIRPQIAQTMVHLQIDLSTVTTKATMAEALRFALKRRGNATPGNLKNPSPKQ